MKCKEYVVQRLMRLTRLYTPDTDFSAAQEILLSPDHAHYLLRVLRMEDGQEIVLFNERAGEWLAALRVVGKKAVAQLREQVRAPFPLPDVWLLISPLKKEAWDFCIEKATELGVAAIRPVLMQYTQNARMNEDRLRANVIEASQQCERISIPQCQKMEKLDAVLRQWDASRILYVALERSDAAPALHQFDPAQPAAILVGPEGGFSPQERELFGRYPFIRPITLGPLVLRAETAALAALTLWAAKDSL